MDWLILILVLLNSIILIKILMVTKQVLTAIRFQKTAIGFRELIEAGLKEPGNEEKDRRVEVGSEVRSQTEHSGAKEGPRSKAEGPDL